MRADAATQSEERVEVGERSVDAALLALEMEEGVPIKECRWLREAEKRRGQIFPRISRRNICQHFDFRTSELLIWKIIDLCYFKPLHFW